MCKEMMWIMRMMRKKGWERERGRERGGEGGREGED
jgi:hypothetical protein